MNTKIFKPIITIIAVLLIATGATAQEAKTMYIVKNSVVTHEFDISRIDSITFYNPNNPNADPTIDEGVIINGVKWATRNVAEPGYFATDPEDAGMFYKWDSKTAWATTGEVDGWDRSYSTGDIWEKSNDPSPAGWHVPTSNDIQKLSDENKVSNEWTTQNGTVGRRFTEKSTGNSIFLPAPGYREGYYGGLKSINSYGSYWGNASIGDGVKVCLTFRTEYLPPPYSGGSNWCSIRPVAD